MTWIYALFHFFWECGKQIYTSIKPLSGNGVPPHKQAKKYHWAYTTHFTSCENVDSEGRGSVLKSQKYEYETTFWQKCCHFSTILAPPIFNSDIRPRVEKNEIWPVVLSCMEVEFCWKLPNYYQILSIFFKLCLRLKNTILLNVFMPVILLSLFVSYQSRTITAPEKQFHHTRFLWTDYRFYSTPVCCAL